MSDLTIALAGGAIGSALTAGASFGRRVLAVRSSVERNDFDAAERNHDLETWVSDEHRQLNQQMAQRTGELTNMGQHSSGAFGLAMASLKSLALHRYRDQERQARRDMAVIRAREDWLHRAYRWVTRRPTPSATAIGRVQPVLDVWRAPARQADGPPAPVHDPTSRTLDDTIRDLAAQRSSLHNTGSAQP